MDAWVVNAGRPRAAPATKGSVMVLAGALWLGLGCLGLQGDYAAHDPAVIRAGDWYWLYSTGDGLPMRRSRDLLTWERCGRVLAALPGWASAAVPGATWLWAPDISRVGDEYRLYYSVSTFGSNRSCIGLAVNHALDPADPAYRWEDRGLVVASQPGDDYNAIDPNLIVDDQGRHWLAFGSFWSGIKLRRLDPATGLADAATAELVSLARRPVAAGAVEAPFIVRRDGWYYLFVSFDLCCKGADSTYRIMVGRAREVTGPYLARDGQAMLDGGATELLAGSGTRRGPGHNAVLADGDRWWLVHHYYDAADRGRAKLSVCPLTFDESGWPVAGDPL